MNWDKVFWFVYRQLLALRMWMLRRKFEAWKREFERDGAEAVRRRAEASSPTVLEPEKSSRARTPAPANPDRLNWN